LDENESSDPSISRFTSTVFELLFFLMVVASHKFLKDLNLFLLIGACNSIINIVRNKNIFLSSENKCTSLTVSQVQQEDTLQSNQE
jgi:hypothetical protein